LARAVGRKEKLGDAAPNTLQRAVCVTTKQEDYADITAEKRCVGPLFVNEHEGGKMKTGDNGN
jgi:hypothetical protein